MYLAILCDDSLRYRSKEQKRHKNRQNNNQCSSSSLLASLRKGAIALSVTLSGGALFANWKLVQFSSSLTSRSFLQRLWGFGPTCCRLSESHLMTVHIASPAFGQPELCFRSQFFVAIGRKMMCSGSSFFMNTDPERILSWPFGYDQGCSYQCDNWYVSNWRFACDTSIIVGGNVLLRLLRGF